MKAKRLLLIGAVLVLGSAVFVFVGCGGSGGGDSTASTTGTWDVSTWDTKTWGS